VKISAPSLAMPSPVTYSRMGAVSGLATGMPETSPAASVQRSGFLAQLQEATRAAPFGEVRAERVAQARADLASGRLGSEADLDAAVSALLQDL
jgi:hypothetical protein